MGQVTCSGAAEAVSRNTLQVPRSKGRWASKNFYNSFRLSFNTNTSTKNCLKSVHQVSQFLSNRVEKNPIWIITAKPLLVIYYWPPTQWHGMEFWGIIDLESSLWCEGAPPSPKYWVRNFVYQSHRVKLKVTQAEKACLWLLFKL